MPTSSISFILAVFVLGFALGALLVAMERRARIDRLKREFQAQLEAIAQGADVAKPEPESASPSPAKTHVGPTRAA